MGENHEQELTDLEMEEARQRAASIPYLPEGIRKKIFRGMGKDGCTERELLQILRRNKVPRRGVSRLRR